MLANDKERCEERCKLPGRQRLQERTPFFRTMGRAIHNCPNFLHIQDQCHKDLFAAGAVHVVISSRCSPVRAVEPIAPQKACSKGVSPLSLVPMT